MSLNTAVLHVTHNDLDGVGCGILIKKCLKNVTTAYLDYSEIDEYILREHHKYASIFITDVTPSVDTMEEITRGKFLTIIDHHISSEYLTVYPYTYHDTTKCATRLTYEWLMGRGHDVSAYRELVDSINDFDLWKLEREDSLQMNMLFLTIGLQRFEQRFLETPYDGFTPSEQLVIDIETERRDAYIARAVRSANIHTDREGRRCAVVFAEQYNSELGNHITAHDLADYVLILNMQRKKASLRSKKAIDVRVIAEANGGGGHKNAAGFSINYDFNINGFLAEAGIL